MHKTAGIPIAISGDDDRVFVAKVIEEVYLESTLWAFGGEVVSHALEISIGKRNGNILICCDWLARTVKDSNHDLRCCIFRHDTSFAAVGWFNLTDTGAKDTRNRDTLPSQIQKRLNAR